MQLQPSEEITDDQIIWQAIACAKQSDWVVLFADCHVQRAAPDADPDDGPDGDYPPDVRLVFMWAQPFYNAQLRSVMPLVCRVELNEGQVGAAHLYLPSDRQQYQ